jgi:hypothetical protein
MLRYNPNPNPIQGPHRGVIITASLRTGRTHQYGGLPLHLFAA